MGKDKFAHGNARKKVPRPQPPHADRRLKRNKTRSDQERAAESDQDLGELSGPMTEEEFLTWLDEN